MSKQEIEPKILELWTKTNIPLTKVHIKRHTQESEAHVSAVVDALVKKGVLDLTNENSSEETYLLKGLQRSSTEIKSFDEWETKKALIKEAKNRILAKRKLEALKSEPSPVNSKKAEPSPSMTRPHPAESEKHISDESDPKPIKKNTTSILKHAAKLKHPEESLSMGLEIAKNAVSKGFDGLDNVSTFNEERKSPVISAALSFFLGPLGWLYAGSFKEAIPAFLIGAGVASLLPSVLLFPLMMVALPASAVGGWLYAWQYNEDGSRKTLFLGDGSESKE